MVGLARIALFITYAATLSSCATGSRSSQCPPSSTGYSSNYIVSPQDDNGIDIFKNDSGAQFNVDSGVDSEPAKSWVWSIWRHEGD